MSKASSMLIVLLLFTSSVFAQQDIQEPQQKDDSAKAKQVDEAKRADIIKMMKLTGSDKMAMQMMNNMIGMQKQTNPNIPTKFWDDFMDEVDPDELLELSVPSWEKHLTHDDIKQLIKFYESPIGKKMIAVQPKIMQESMVAGQKWGMELGKRIAERMQSEGF